MSSRRRGVGMGIPTFVRDYLKAHYVGAFSYELRSGHMPTVVVYDLMQDIKVLPETIVTMEQTIVYFVNKIKTLFYHHKHGGAIQTVIVCVDRKPPVVKRLVTHEKRYKNVDVLASKSAPHLPFRPGDPVPLPWIRFAGNYKLLQRELYPRLFNALLQLPLKPQQKMILHGFPAYCEWIAVPKQQAYTLNTNEAGRVLQIHTWTDDDLPLTKVREQQDPDLYNRVYFMEHVPPCAVFPQGCVLRQQWDEATNAINETDGAMFFYDHWFQNDCMMFSCNDGDAFAYGLLYTYERTTLQNTFRNQHILRLPYKKIAGREAFPPDKIPRYEYVDLNVLYQLVKDDSTMKASGVQNHVVTLVFLMIMAGSDFFQDCMKGIGAEKGIWQTFLASLGSFTHLVQESKGVVQSTRPTLSRTIVLDEERFRIFVIQCYADKHGAAVKKKSKNDTFTLEELRVHCNTSKRASSDEEYKMPTRNKIRLWARQVLWNLSYYRNAPFDKTPDPFETCASDGLPYYPYIRNPITGKPEMSPVVSAFEKPLDEVYKQHMYGSHKEETSAAARKRERE